MIALINTPKPVRLRSGLLENGDRMTQAEFHRVYENYDEDVKFELIGGVVYMAAAMRHPHGSFHIKLTYALEHFATATPGIEIADNASVILGDESEPQPDLSMRIETDCGGQSHIDERGYLTGAPELVAEIAHSSRALDLHAKRDDYQRAGVLEYVVLCVEERELHWFHFPTGTQIEPTREGIYRSRVFPGLWIDGPALMAKNSIQLRATVERGLARREHATFVRRLAAIRKKAD